MSKRVSSALLGLLIYINNKFNIGVGTKIFIPFFMITFLILGAVSYFAMNTISSKIGEMERKRANAVLKTILLLL